MSNIIPNAEFLSHYQSPEFQGAILPQEKDLITKRLRDLGIAQQEIIDQKVSVTGGDDWHDGAFRATDHEAQIVSQQAARLGTYLRSVVVDFPEPGEPRATLGSRVTLDQAGDVYKVEIVGVPLLHEADESAEEVLPCSLESPVARSIIGKQAGHTALLQVAGRTNRVEVLAVDQLAMKQYLEDEIAR